MAACKYSQHQHPLSMVQTTGKNCRVVQVVTWAANVAYRLLAQCLSLGVPVGWRGCGRASTSARLLSPHGSARVRTSRSAGTPGMS